MVRIPVLPAAGRGGKALLADVAGDGQLLQVRVHVAPQVRRQAEGLAALGAAVAFHLGVDLQRVRVRKCLQAQGAVVEIPRVGLLVVQERSGVAVGASAQVTPALATYQHGNTREDAVVLRLKHGAQMTNLGSASTLSGALCQCGLSRY